MVYTSWYLTPLFVSLAKNHGWIYIKITEFPETKVNSKDDKGMTLLTAILAKF